MATHSGRSYNSHQLAQLHQGQFLQASGGVGTKEGDLRSPWCRFLCHSQVMTLWSHAMKLRFCVACGTDDVVPVGFDGTQRARDE
jgi:hypothetical protein